MALTSSDDTNTLAVSHFRRLLGPDKVHQISSTEVAFARQNENSPAVRGEDFSRHADYDTLAFFSREGTVKTTPITIEFTYQDFLAHYGERVLPLLVVGATGIPRVLKGKETFPLAGERIISFLLPEQWQTSSGSDVTLQTKNGAE
jgi:hypothetical protein